jgi:SSS family solute:Na+ symporter
MFQFLFLALIIPLVPVGLIFGWGLDSTQRAGIEARLAGDMLGSMPVGALIAGMLSFFLGEFLLPPYTQRVFIGKTSRTTQRAFFLACLLFVAWVVITVSTGVLLRDVLPQEPTPDAVLLKAIDRMTPSGWAVKGVLCAAIAAVIMSVQDSFVLSAGTCFVHDFYRVARPNAAHPELLLGARLAMVATGLLGWLFSMTLPSLIEGLLYLYTFWSPTVVPPLVLAILGAPAHRRSGLAAILVGGAVTAVWEFVLGQPGGVPSIVVGLVANQVGYWLPVALFGRTPATTPRDESGVVRAIPANLQRVGA